MRAVTALAWGLRVSRVPAPTRSSLLFLGVARRVRRRRRASTAPIRHALPFPLDLVVNLVAYTAGLPLLWFLLSWFLLPHRAAHWHELVPGALVVGIGVGAIGLFNSLVLFPWLTGGRRRTACSASPRACSSASSSSVGRWSWPPPSTPRWQRSDGVECRNDPRGRRARRAAHPPRRLGRLRHPLVDRARAGDRPAGEGLLGVRRARHRVRPARRPGSRRARPDLPLDGGHPVVAARGRAVGARRDRRRLPLAADHDTRAALQPDEAEPRRRARPRPHHPRRDPRRRSREHRVPAGARRADPDDGSHLRPAPQRDHRRQGDLAGPDEASSASTSPGRAPVAAATTTRRSSPSSRRPARPGSA